MKKNNKEKRITIRFDEKEYKHVKRQAGRLPLATFIRQVLFFTIGDK